MKKEQRPVEQRTRRIRDTRPAFTKREFVLSDVLQNLQRRGAKFVPKDVSSGRPWDILDVSKVRNMGIKSLGMIDFINKKTLILVKQSTKMKKLQEITLDNYVQRSKEITHTTIVKNYNDSTMFIDKTSYQVVLVKLMSQSNEWKYFVR